MNYELRIKGGKTKPSSASSGYVAILSVIIVGAVVVAIGFSLFLLGVSNAKSTQTIKYTSLARGLASACAEEALATIATNSAFVGTKNPVIATSDGTCGFTVGTGTGEIRGIYATGSASTVVRRITISIGAISPKITISSWQETQ